MVKSKERVNRAQDRALESLDYVMDCYETPDFVEVTGRMGGDVITYRVFDDGRIYAKQENHIRKKYQAGNVLALCPCVPEMIAREGFRL